MTRKQQPQPNKKPTNKTNQNDIKQRFLDASTDYADALAKATPEDIMRAEALEISVAEEKQQQMADSDFSHFYNLGQAVSGMGSDLMREDYKAWLSAWGLEDPKGTPPKKKFRY